jgi:hypothetical protein
LSPTTVSLWSQKSRVPVLQRSTKSETSFGLDRGSATLPHSQSIYSSPKWRFLGDKTRSWTAPEFGKSISSFQGSPRIDSTASKENVHDTPGKYIIRNKISQGQEKKDNRSLVNLQPHANKGKLLSQEIFLRPETPKISSSPIRTLHNNNIFFIIVYMSLKILIY